MKEMFEVAQRTPSWCNTQPWQVYVTSGDAIDRLATELVARAQEGRVTSDLPTPGRYVGVYAERRRQAGHALYESVGIEKSDRAGRDRQMLRNFSFFGAPHVAVVTTDSQLGVYGAVDCGGYVANLVNAASSWGVASIPQAAIAMHSDSVREILSIPADRRVVCAVSFGYPDGSHPANRFRTPRASVPEAVTFVE